MKDTIIHPSENIFIVLKNTNLLWETLVSSRQSCVFKKGESIDFIDKGKKALFYISQGTSLQIFKSIYFREKLIDIYGKGVLMGETQTMIGDVYWEAVALTDVEGYFLPLEEIQSIEFMKKYPQLVLNLQESQAIKMFRNFHHAASLAVHSAKRYLCRLLLVLSYENDNADVFSLGMSQEVFASHIGIFRGSFMNLVRQLKDEGVIAKLSKNQVIISNRKLLTEYAYLPEKMNKNEE